MKNFLSALWKILLLTVVFFIANAVSGMLLPLSNDLMAAMTSEDRAAFMPLFLLIVFIRMTMMYIMLICLRYRGWKLFLSVWMAFWGLFTVVNSMELYWYNESFPLITYLDTTKLILSGCIDFGVTALLGTWLTGGFKKKEAKPQTVFMAGRYGSRIGLFLVLYPLFYYACGFIPWSFPEIRAFYTNWVMTSEPIYVLLLFNIPRAALWFLFSLPVLLGSVTRRQAYWFMPSILVVATAFAMIIPSALMPGMVRLGHFIELGFSMTVVGLFMVWLFLKERPVKELTNE